MFGSGFSDIELPQLLTMVSQEQIASHYLGITDIPCVINAPYRSDEKPSLGIYLAKNDNVSFTDFGTKESGDVITLLMKIWRCDFRTCISRIYNDLGKFDNQVKTRDSMGRIKTLNHKSPVEIKVKFREWRDYDLEFWESYGISKPWLEFGDIHPISRIFFLSGETTRDFPAEKYAYVYIERKDNIVTLKIYQPKSTVCKWMSKHDSSVWDLWTKIPQKGKDLIITSSRKDALCLWENTGIPSVSLQGEGYIPKEHVINELKERFENIYILYDNDFQATENHGRIFATELSKRFNLIMIEIPDEYRAKDPSDLCLKYGRQKVREVILNLINTSINNLNKQTNERNI